MHTNYGEQLASRESRPGAARWMRVGAVALLLLFGIGGIYFILNPYDPGDEPFGFFSLGLGVLLCVLLFVAAKRRHATATIYEEGVVLRKGKNERGFHFSEIAGLIDQGGGSMVVPVAGGLIGAAVMGVASAIASNAVDAHRRTHRLRSVNIMPTEPKGTLESVLGIKVVNTAGDELSKVYTEWLVKTKNINEETVKSLELSFALDDLLRVDKGAFVSKNRRGENRFEFERLADLDVDEVVRFWGLDEKGKNKCLIDIKTVQVLNLDLLFYVFDLSKGKSGEAEETDET